MLDDLIEQGLGDQADDYLLLWADILRIDGVDQLRAGLEIMKQIADKRREIDGLYAHLSRSMGRQAFARRRPMQILRLMGQRDQTLVQTAKKLGTSESTANHHIATAGRSFFCKTNAGAVYAAVKEGLV
ncbi:MAG: hypothetical protein MI785_13480 [Kiloniellales bacterium]|nr:hypothetical protein [Kiloniellales bacterium]